MLRNVRVLLALTTAFLLACDQDVTDDPTTELQSVDVVFGDQTHTVDLGDVTAVTFNDDDEHAQLSAVIAAAGITEPLTSLQVDFLAGDGFVPTNSPNCTEELVPVAGELLEQGYIHMRTRRVVWEESLGFPGCLSVSNTVQIIITEVERPTGPTVTVSYGETQVEVYLSQTETVTIEGEDYARLTEVVELAELGTPTADLMFDFTADGFRPSDSPNCASVVPLSAETLGQGYIHKESKDLAWDEAADMPGCMGVNGVLTIEVTD